MYITDKDGNYIPSATIQGEDGKEVELRVYNGYVQWKREDTLWTNLINMDVLQGEPGDKIMLHAESYIIQYKYESDSEWTNLIDLSEYFGNAAAAKAAASANEAASRANEAIDSANSAANRANAAAERAENAATATGNVTHAFRHASDGADPLTPDAIGAATKDHSHSLDDLGAATKDHSHKPTEIGAEKAVVRSTQSGTEIELSISDGTEYRFSDAITSLTLIYPSEIFDCWLSFTTGDSITITFPSETKYIGGAPEFEALKSYEISIKDSVAVVAEVVSE